MELWAPSDGVNCQPQTALKTEESGEIPPGGAWTWKLSETYPGPINDKYAQSAVITADGKIAVTVQRTQTAPGAGEDYRSSIYTAISTEMEGEPPAGDPYMYYVPLVYSDGGGLGWSSSIWIQNAGDYPAPVDIYYQEMGNCEEWEVAHILCLYPGKSFKAPAPSWSGIGSAWIRATEPLGIIADAENADKSILLSYRGMPVEYFGGGTFGATTNYGPLIYREYNGWNSGVQVQNLSSTTNALVKVYFLDNSGDITTTMVDWICKRGSTTFFLPAINNLPGDYVGAFRVESMDWQTPGDPEVSAPNVLSVVNLINYDTGQGLSYNAFPAQEAEGVAVIALPFLVKEKHDQFEPTGTTWTSEIAVHNLNPNPGETCFDVKFYSPAGALLTTVPQCVNEKQVDYIKLANYGNIFPGSEVSAKIVAKSSTQPGGPALAAVVVNKATGYPSGDLTTGYEGFPIIAEMVLCTGDVYGAVYAENTNEPIEGATVSVGGKTAETDSSGLYAIEDVTGGKYKASAAKEGYLTSFKDVTVICDEDVQLNFELICNTNKITGTVTMTPTVPVPDALVTATWTPYAGTDDDGFEQTTTDATGYYELTNLPKEVEITVEISKDGFDTYSTTHKFTGATCGESFVISPDLERWAEVKGIVFSDENGNGTYDAGEPKLAGETVDLYTDGQAKWLASTTTDAEGQYKFFVSPGLFPGDFSWGDNLDVAVGTTVADANDIEEGEVVVVNITVP